MTQLYRIKPLEWHDGNNPRIKARSRSAANALGSRYVIDPDGGEFVAWLSTQPIARAKSLDEAKAACEKHRRQLLEAELEPAYQPTTELPTEPGLYWWMKVGETEWLYADVGSVFIFFGGQHFHRSEWEEKFGRGQWIRIPEPGKGEA